MIKKILICILFMTFYANSHAQNPLWRKTSEEKVQMLTKMERASTPRTFELFSLDLAALKTQLLAAPLDTQNHSNVVISFPNPNGVMDSYHIFEAPIMEAGLSAKYPDIKSYVGKGIEDPTATIRFSVTLFGLHAMTLSGKTGTAFIDTYTKDLNNYIVYSKSNIAPSRNFECLVKGASNTLDSSNELPNIAQKSSDGKFRIFRLAMACTIEYATFHVNAAGLSGGTLAQKKAAVLAAMGVTMTRVNGLYERDLSMRMNLVATNDQIIFITSDNFNNTNASTLINQSQAQITSIIGSANFDIGHTVSTGGGGLAGPSPCVDSSKASGITGSPAPVGDPYDIDYVAHEMGHQFGANHTFNNSCSGNRNDGTAIEPGSGSTIMAYAGICAPNVQSNSDAHFHAVSIAEIEELIASSATCGVTTNNGNNAPVVNAGLDYVIPKSTPFILNGSATDANGDSLTYCWEQTDTEISTQSPVATSVGGPNFRSNPPIVSSARYMPSLATVLTGSTANTWEVCSSVARSFNFALTVRDNKTPNGGQTGRDDMKVTVNATAGPFLVSIPNTNVSWGVGTNQVVTWAVAGTTANGVNAAFVDIYLSNDGGNTYPILLASKVPNDGTETVTIPNTVGTTNRIMIKGNNHIFYDISNTNFTITAALSGFAVGFDGTANGQNKETCQGGNAVFTIPYTTYGGFSGTTSFSAVGLPAGAIATFSPTTISANGTVTMTVSNTNGGVAGVYSIVVTATSGTTKTVPLYLNLLSSNFGVQALTGPANLTNGVSTTAFLTWPANAAASSYTVQVATDSGFTNVVSTGTVATTSYTASGLVEATQYYWRVLPKNTSCAGTYSAAYRFTTGTSACAVYSNNLTVAIADGTGANIAGPVASKTIIVPAGSNLNDVNVSLSFTHTYIEDLVIWLVHPDGTQVSLWDRNCDEEFDNVSVTFSDGNASIPSAGCTVSTGTFSPDSPLSVLNGKASAGTWTLKATDNFNGDTGSLLSWSLDICTAQPLGVSQNALSNFVIYPNPNKGNFTVQFNSDSGNDVAVSVHDISGRKIFDKKYTNTGLFSQNLQLEHVQTGVYLVTVQDGDNKVVKRIVVE